MLPAGWNDAGENYALMYQPTDLSDSTTLMLKVVSFDGLLLTHLLVRFTSMSYLKRYLNVQFVAPVTGKMCIIDTPVACNNIVLCIER